MKKLISIASLLAVMFAAVSCQKDSAAQMENVSFSVVVPGNPVTKAQMSDGTTADQLMYEVYVGNDVMYKGAVDASANLTAEGYRQFALNLQLVKGQEYDILFWAQKKNTGFYNTSDLKSVSVNYGEGTIANDEKRDAFYGKLLNFTPVLGPTTVTLSRPFAQVNYAVSPSDWESLAPFVTNGLKSKYLISEVHTHFNVYEGDVIANSKTSNVVMDFALAPVSESSYTNDVITYNNVSYKWAAMAYIFAPKAGSDIGSIKASFVHDKNANNPIEVEVSNVPVMQNYKTNILGEMASSASQFNVVIVPGFDGTLIK